MNLEVDQQCSEFQELLEFLLNTRVCRLTRALKKVRVFSPAYSDSASTIAINGRTHACISAQLEEAEVACSSANAVQ